MTYIYIYMYMLKLVKKLYMYKTVYVYIQPPKWMMVKRTYQEPMAARSVSFYSPGCWV